MSVRIQTESKYLLGLCLAVCALSACTFIFSESSNGDAGGDAATLADDGGPLPVRRCSTTIFEDPMLVEIQGLPVGTILDDPTFRQDGMVIYYNEKPADNIARIFRASRSSPSNFEISEEVDLGTPDFCIDTSPELSRDGLILYFASSRPLSGQPPCPAIPPTPATNLNIWSIARTSTAVAFSINLTQISELRTTDLDTPSTPFTSADMTESMLVTRTKSGTDGNGIMSLTTNSGGPWTMPAIPLQNVNDSSEKNIDPYVTEDGLTLLFNRSEDLGQNSHDIFIAERESTSDPFEVPVPLMGDDVNGASSDTDPWLSRDGCTLYFASKRDGTSKLYVATRPFDN